MNILAGDIGGTKTLLGIYTFEEQLIKIYQKRYLSYKWSSIDSIIQNFLETLPKEISPPRIGCLALAGPVNNGSCSITNLGWEISHKNIIKLANLDVLELINDISVLIYGIPFLTQSQFVEIQPRIDQGNDEETIAVIAAGTGLGMAKGLRKNKNVMVFPSEGGHREFSPRSEEEWRLAEWLKSDLKLKRLSIERIVSGNGLGHVARWRLNQSDASSHPLRKVSEAWAYKKGNFQDLPALASDAANNGDGIMKEALQIWLSAYGSAAGDLALQELCNGGLWISGGTAAKQLEGIRSASFLEAFKSKGRFYKYLEKLPLMALIDPEAGMFSAACRGRMLA